VKVKLHDVVATVAESAQKPPYLRLIDFVYHSTLGLKVIKKKKKYP